MHDGTDPSTLRGRYHPGDTDPHLPQNVVRARTRQAQAAKEAQRALRVPGSHLDNRHCLQAAEEVSATEMLRTFPHPTLVG